MSPVHLSHCYKTFLATKIVLFLLNAIENSDECWFFEISNEITVINIVKIRLI